jgi:SAM-dependent methyltransferase
MGPFADHFSVCAGSYAAFRPSYPTGLIETLAGWSPSRQLAWDVGTGNGQAAVLLADRFARVVATDASAEQIAHARAHPRVTYRVAPEDDSGLPGEAADLVTVAQALHWFDLPRFYREVDRVLARNGVLAVWTYGLLTVDPEVDRAMQWFYTERVGRYWPRERVHVDLGYRDLPFPYREMETESWEFRSRLTRAQLEGYAATWSAVKECRVREHADPIPQLQAALRTVWPDPEQRREVVWPIALRAGRRQPKSCSPSP